MKKSISLLLFLALMLACFTGCTSGVSQAEYDRVVAERDALAKQIEALENQTTQKAPVTPKVANDTSTETPVSTEPEASDTFYEDDMFKITDVEYSASDDKFEISGNLQNLTSEEYLTVIIYWQLLDSDGNKVDSLMTGINGVLPNSAASFSDDKYHTKAVRAEVYRIDY